MNTHVENLGDTVLKWVTAEGYTIQPQKEPGFSSFYAISSSAESGHRLSISQAANEDKIVVAGGVKIDSPDQTKLSGFPVEMRRQILAALAWLMYGRSVFFRIDENDGVVKSITFSQNIYSDGLTKDRLMKSIADMFMTEALLLIQITSYLDQASKFDPTRPIHSDERETRVPKEEPAGKSWKIVDVSSHICPNCRKELPLGMKFCKYCGTKQ